MICIFGIMSLPNIYKQETVNQLIERIHKIKPDTHPQWGKMNAGQMLAHCNVTYEMAIDGKHAKAKGVKRWLLTKFVKPVVVSEKPYKKNGSTAPEFKVSPKQEFEKEKERLVNYLQKSCELGEAHFEGKESNSFGKLNKTEWNNMFYKHLDHHLVQFGV